jgi:7 transmembrane receptor (Secretin family)
MTKSLGRSEWVIGVTSLVSCVSCLSIIVTYMVFKDLRKQAYLSLILYIAACDFLSSFLLITTTKNHSIQCWTQGILLNYFQLASTLWIDVIVWHLYRTVILGKSIKNNLKYHLFCWGVPLLYIALTLTTNDYGVSSGEDLGYCWVVRRSASRPGPLPSAYPLDILTLYPLLGESIGHPVLDHSLLGDRFLLDRVDLLHSDRPTHRLHPAEGTSNQVRKPHTHALTG